LTVFVTPDSLPESLQEIPATIEGVARDLQTESGGKFEYELIDPDDANSPVSRDSLVNNYGLYPIATSLFSQDSYYLHMVLQIGDEAQLLYATGDLTKADIRSELEASLKRAAPGFLKTVGLWLPQLGPVPDMFGGTTQPLSSWNTLQEQLRQNYTVKTVDLTSGRVAADVDVLIMVAPQGLTDAELFAVDQYLMRGGAVIVAGGSHALAQQQFPGGITVEALQGTLADMLASYGVEVEGAMVLDPQNEPFPVQVQRQVGGMQVVEIQQLDYPYFVDVRPDGMNNESPIVSNLPSVTLQWVSPLKLDEAQNEGREVTVLLESTEDSWQRSATDVQPNPEIYPEYGFPVEGEQAARPLAVSIRGSFESYFKDQPSPFEGSESVTETVAGPLGTIPTSPETARLVVIGSAEFVDDVILDLSQNLSADRYLYNLQLVQNAVDWAVEDEDLLSIRSGGTYARLLRDLEEGQQSFWEMLNYALVLVSLVIVGVVSQIRRREEPMLPLPGAEGEPVAQGEPVEQGEREDEEAGDE
jgi:ABC-2 type transport system permease protein